MAFVCYACNGFVLSWAFTPRAIPLGISCKYIDTTKTSTGARFLKKWESNNKDPIHYQRISNGIVSFSARLGDEDEIQDIDDDDDDEFIEPLSNGVDSVSWLPTVVGKRGPGHNNSELSVNKDSEIIPLFPLGGIVYTPNSEHILNIFEKRYREMYTDILMNGTKRFAVSMSHPTEQGRFAQMAVLFELKDLKEVSEQTGDRIKYICNHKVTGRVKLHRILNPEGVSNFSFLVFVSLFFAN